MRFSISCLIMHFQSVLAEAFYFINNWATSWENLFMPYANNKGADQSAHPRSLISAFVVHYLDSIKPLVSLSESSNIYLASVAAQAGLCLAWSQTPKTGFLVARLNCIWRYCPQWPSYLHQRLWHMAWTLMDISRAIFCLLYLIFNTTATHRVSYITYM